MTGLTFADPEVFDLSATSGSHTFTPVNPANLIVHASQNSDTTYFQPSAALDHNRDTAWETGVVKSGTTVTPTSLTVRRPDSASITVVSYTLSTRNGQSPRAPKNFELQGSNDATSWTSVDTRTNITSWSDGTGGVKTFVLSTPATFVYWRLVVTDTQTAGQILNLGELYFNDIENSDPPPQPVYYVRLTNIPHGRVIDVDIPSNMLTSYGSGGNIGWQALTALYPESSGDTLGIYDPYGSAQFFYGWGGDVILRVWIETYADFTLNWTSTECPTSQPRTWFDRAVLSVSGATGTATYDGTKMRPDVEPRRLYSLTPTSSDPLTITTNEPNSYFELYAETGVTTYDAYLDDGQNDATGAPDPSNPLVITPTPGQEYVIVVYPGYQPTEATTYTLTWSQESLTPPPYVVSNDMIINALDLGKATAGLTHGYDNTGATVDPEVAGKRSIWYRFHVDEPSFVKIVATPSSSGPDKAPSLYVFTSDAITSGVGFGGEASVTYPYVLAAGGEYYLMISFDESIPTSDWEQTGSMLFDVKPAPPHTSDPNFTLPPGDANPGGGQNYHVGPVFPGTGVGASGVMKIVAPSDGGLSLIIEAGNEGGTTAQPWVVVELPYSYETGNVIGTVHEQKPVALDTSVADPLHPTQMPWRAVGASTPDPVTFSVAAGDVITVRVISAPSGAYVRWGMTTVTKSPSDWVSARYGNYLTNDGTETPGGMTGDQAAEVAASAVAWPVDTGLVLGQRPDDQASYYDDIADNPLARRKTQWVLTDSQSGLTGSPSDEIDWAPIDPYLNAATHGGNASNNGGSVTRATDDWPNQDELYNSMGGRILFDPATAKTITDMTTHLTLSRQEAYVAHDKRYESRVNDGTDDYFTLQPETARGNVLLDGLRPVVNRAEQGSLESTRPWYDPAAPGFGVFGAEGDIIRMLTWRIEWSGGQIGPAKEVYNLYRWVHSLAATRSARDPYAAQTLPFNGAEVNPDYDPDGDWTTLRSVDMGVNVYSIEVEATDVGWVPPEVIASGQLVASTTFPSQTIVPLGPLTVSDPGVKNRDFGGMSFPFEDTLYRSDIFGSSRPEVGSKLYDNVYAAMMSPYENGFFDWGPAISVYWGIRGYVNGPPYQFTLGSFFYIWEVSGRIRTVAGRKYPDQFRVALWEPSLAAIVPLTPSTPQPGAGYYVLPHPNLDGEGNGVDVHFASAT